MGSGRFDMNSYRTYATASTVNANGISMDAHEVFKQRKLEQSLDPKLALLRESRDSETSPNSRAIILALDVTGSMGIIAHEMAKTQIGDLMGSIFEKSPVKDPHIMLMGVGDIKTDRAPFQVSQFEADIRIAEQLLKLYLEGGGGGNDTESYDLPWYYAANHTSIDCFEKRGEKGYLFTIGDEMPPTGVHEGQLKNLFGVPQSQNYTAKDLYKAACEKYHVFHIIVEEGDYARRRGAAVKQAWYDFMGKRAIALRDYHQLSEVITAVIRVNEGEDADDVVASYPDKSSVSHALFSKIKAPLP